MSARLARGSSIESIGQIKWWRTAEGVVIEYPATMSREDALSQLKDCAEDLPHSFISERTEVEGRITETINFK